MADLRPHSLAAGITTGLVVLLLAAAPPLPAAGEYSFHLGGDPVHPRILPVRSERLGVPAPGDVGFVADIPFVLQGPGRYRLRLGSGPGKRLLCRIDDGPEHLAGVVVAFGTPELPPADWKTTALAVRGAAPGTPPGARVDLPALPRALRYLSFASPGERHPIRLDEASLRGLPDLLYLSVELAGEVLPLGPLRHSRNLRNLSIEGGGIDAAATLAELGALRFLKLRSLRGLESVAFAGRLPELRVLKIDGSAVTDLRPLDGAGALRLLSANETGVVSLPPLSGLPSLRDLRLHSTPVSRNRALMRSLRPRLSLLVKNWDPSIRAFEAADAAAPPPADALLFVGSSSIRLWNLAESFPGRATMNRGFGGSELSDALMYFDRIVLPYRPRAIILYAGDNDLSRGESAGQVLDDYERFAARVRTRLPDTDFAFLAIKPSPDRWGLWPEMARANDAVRKVAATHPRLHFLDVATPMLGDDGRPRPGLFSDDGLHLNREGYALWTGIVRKWLEAQ